MVVRKCRVRMAMTWIPGSGGCGTPSQVPNPSHLSFSVCRVEITIVPTIQNCYNACEVPNVSLD